MGAVVMCEAMVMWEYSGNVGCRGDVGFSGDVWVQW